VLSLSALLGLKKVHPVLEQDIFEKLAGLGPAPRFLWRCRLPLERMCPN
jgi:hypothetical protein